MLEMKEIWELAEPVIASGGEFRFFHKGTSMNPLLRQGIDSVVIVSPENLKKNDIALYKRANGQFVMHRIIKIKKENILAKVKGIYRGDTYFEVDNRDYKKYVRKLPIRRAKIRFFYFIGINKRT